MVDKHVIQNLIKNSDKPDSTLFIHSKFICNTIYYETLNTIIDSIQSKMSAGHDDIPIKIIKEDKQSLMKPLLHVINSSLVTGVFPGKLNI